MPEDGGQPGGGDVAEPVGAAIASRSKAGRRNPCPNCGSRSVAAFCYGYPAPSVFEDPGLAAGEFVLGGCCIVPDMPEFHCNACGYEWRRKAAPEGWMSESVAQYVQPIERLSFDAAELMRAHPPRIEDDRKLVIASIAAPPDAVHTGRIEYSRWAAMPLPPHVAPGAAANLLEVRDGWFDYEDAQDARQRVAPEDAQDARQRVAPAQHWYVNFADGELFGYYAERFFAQDEVQVAEHPALAAVREALRAGAGVPRTVEDGEPTPVLVAGVERRVAIDTTPNAAEGRPLGIYGRNLGTVSMEALRRAVHPLDPPTRTNVIAIAARANGSGLYSRDDVDSTLRTAYTGFRAALMEAGRRATEESAPAVPATAASARLAPARCELIVHSGFWGCGAFGGNRTMMTLLQILAAQLAGIDGLVYHVGDPAGRVSVDRALALSRSLGRVTYTQELIDRITGLGLLWGSSDGS